MEQKKTFDLKSHPLVCDALDQGRLHPDPRQDEAARSKRLFLAKVGHEMRTPLNIIINLNALALERAQDEQQRDILRHAQRVARELLSLINDILDFSSADAKQLTLNQAPFDVRELIDSIALQAHGMAVNKPIGIYFQVAPDLPRHLIGDRRRIGQVLHHLLSNAIKFTAQGQIVFSIRSQGENDQGVRLLFTVTDTGIGLTEAQLAELFQPFHQMDNAISRQYDGIGLGLAFSQQLVELMAGDLRVSSLPERGTTASFALPLPRTDADVLFDLNDYAALRTCRALIVSPPGTLRDFVLDAVSAMRFQTCHECATLNDALIMACQAASQGKAFDLLLINAGLIDNLGTADRAALRALVTPTPPASPLGLIAIAPHLDSCAEDVPTGVDPIWLEQPLTLCGLVRAMEQALPTARSAAPLRDQPSFNQQPDQGIPDSLVPDLQLWRQLLDQDITATRRQGEILCNTLLGSRLESRIRRIARAIDDYEIDHAQAAIKQLIAELTQGDAH